MSPGHKLGSFYDRNSPSRAGDQGVARVVAVFPPDAESSGAAYFMLESAYDCPANLTRNLAGAFYSDTGQELGRGAAEEKWFPVAKSDPVDVAIQVAACEGRLPSGARSFNRLVDAVAWYRNGGR